MEQELKDNIAIYVDRIGSGYASDAAFKKIRDISCMYENDKETVVGIADCIVGMLKYQTSVIEYLHCKDEEVDNFCMSISKTEI